MSSYKMPRVRKGQVVIWKPEPSATEESAAIVTGVSNSGIVVSLAVFMDGFTVLRPIDGVRHVSDPDKEAIRASNAGVWDYGDETRALNACCDAVATINRYMASLAKDVESLKSAK